MKPAAHTLALGLCIALPATNTAQAEATIGRLFSTPAERVELDAHRGAPAAQQQVNAAAGQPGVAPAAANMPGMPGMPGMPADPGAQQQQQPAPLSSLVLSGVLRTSSGRSTVWLNDTPQNDSQNTFVQRTHDATTLTVTLPSGKKVQLKAGQRYDLNEGRVKDVNEP